MKKLAIILTAIVLLLSATAFASGGEKVNTKVNVAFQKDFTKAENINWAKKGDFYFATFVMNDNEVDAAYNEEGELVGVSRKIETAQLPLIISLALSQKYGQYTVLKEATELSYEGETHYFVVAKNSKQTLKLNCRSNGEISIDKKIKNS